MNMSKVVTINIEQTKYIIKAGRTHAPFPSSPSTSKDREKISERIMLTLRLPSLESNLGMNIREVIVRTAAQVYRTPTYFELM